MSSNIFTMSSDALPVDAEVVGFRGQEGLSEPYRFEIGFLTSDPSFSEEAALMARATLAFQLGFEATPYRFHGVLASVELVHAFGGKMLYRAVLVPKLWQLTLTRHSNVWTDATVPSVLSDVLRWSGLAAEEFSFALSQDYAPREFVAQYKEDNLTFFHRWLERMGMSYYFEQGEQNERLVVIDGPSYDKVSGPGAVKYRPLSEADVMALEAFEFVRQKARVLPGSVALHDYDYLKPMLELRSDARVSKFTVGTINRFADDFHATPSEGALYAKLRAEAMQASQKVLQARGRVFHLAAGRLFSLDDHPRAELNRKYLVTAVSHEGVQAAALPEVKEALGLELDKEYMCEVHAIPADLTYRTPADRTPWPRISSYELATVCGETDSPYAQIDDQGRYKVRMMFDESDLGAGKASTWVRQQQPYGGSTEGFHFPLLKGTEVTVMFLGGDPDRPVIAGVVPNTQKPSPVVAKNHTQNVIQTVNENLIKIEDKLGEQFVHISCPIETSWMHLGVLKDGFNAILSTLGHGHFNFGGHQVVDVAFTLTENVQSDVTTNYFASWFSNVVGDNEIEILGMKSLHVVGDVHYDFDALWKTTVLGDKMTDVSGVLGLHVVGDVTENFDANRTTHVAANETVTVDGNETTTLMGNLLQTVNGTSTYTFEGNRSVSVNGAIKEGFWNIHSSINGGAKFETFLGLKNDNMIGVQMSTFLGLRRETSLAVTMKMQMGAEVNLAPNLKFSLRGPRIDSMTTRIEQVMGPVLLNGAIWLENRGLKVVL